MKSTEIGNVEHRLNNKKRRGNGLNNGKGTSSSSLSLSVAPCLLYTVNSEQEKKKFDWNLPFQASFKQPPDIVKYIVIITRISIGNGLTTAPPSFCPDFEALYFRRVSSTIDSL